MRVEELTAANQDEVRALLLEGLADHWDDIDPSLNPDLDDLVTAYRHGRTILVRDDRGGLVGTGTVVPRGGNEAEIVRMSVSRRARRGGIGRRIVEELLATARGWGASAVVLETTSAWADVVSFYIHCGFVITHTEEGQFGSDTWFRRTMD